MIAAGGSTPLPYTEVDYIETDGTAYIDTGIAGNTPKSAELNIVPVIPASGNGYIMGCRKDSGDTRLVFLLVRYTGFAGYAYMGNIFNNGSVDSINCSDSANNKTMMTVRCSFTSGSQYFGIKQSGESSYTTRHTTVSGTLTENTRNIIVFGMLGGSGSVSTATAGTRIQHIKIWDNAEYLGNLVFDGVACQYNGEYGLWDKVTDTFFGNAAGGGAFSGPSNS